MEERNPVQRKYQWSLDLTSAVESEPSAKLGKRSEAKVAAVTIDFPSQGLSTSAQIEPQRGNGNQTRLREAKTQTLCGFSRLIVNAEPSHCLKWFDFGCGFFLEFDRSAPSGKNNMSCNKKKIKSCDALRRESRPASCRFQAAGGNGIDKIHDFYINKVRGGIGK